VARYIPPSSEEQDAKISLTTYYNYVEAFRFLAVVRNPERTQTEIPSFAKLQLRNAVEGPDLRKPLYRGWLTWRAMRSLPVQTDPGLARSANFWLPVQAYYALHGVGLAAICALCSEAPSTHRKFLTTFANQVVRLLPFPLNLRCVGNPALKDTLRFEGIDIPVPEVRRTSNLSNPQSNADALAAKALITTRQRDFDDRCDEQRKNKRIKRLGAARKVEIGKNMAPTSVADFYYRLRIRANYDDPDMFVYGEESDEAARDRYANLISLTEMALSSLEQIIKKKVGDSEWEKLRSGIFKRRTEP
jgi:hypothetical protein